MKLEEFNQKILKASKKTKNKKKSQQFESSSANVHIVREDLPTLRCENDQ